MSGTSLLRTAVTWTAMVLLVALILRWSGGLTPQALAAAVALAALTFYLGARRARQTLARIQYHLAVGEPDKLLALVDRQLRHRRSPAARGPLLVFRAAGQSMQGDWEGALATLDEVDPEAMPEPGRAVWQFGYWGARFGCLVFTERIEEARRVLEQHIEPLAGTEELRHAGDAVTAARAELAFCDGEYERARPIFERLVADGRVPPASRAVFHYFLGRIADEEGEGGQARRHFSRAVALAPRTWIPAGIRVLNEGA